MRGTARSAGRLRQAVLLAVAAAVLAVAALRGASLAGAPLTGASQTSSTAAAAAGERPTGERPAGERLGALGERRWYAWSQRHPMMNAAFAEAARRLPAGARVVWVVPPGVQPRWVEIMAFYHLPGAWTVAVRSRAGDAAADTSGATWRVDVYGDGRVLVRPRR